MTPLPLTNMVAILGIIVLMAWLSWLVMRHDFGFGAGVQGAGVQLPRYGPDYSTWKTYSGPAVCPHCGEAITADDVADMVDAGEAAA